MTAKKGQRKGVKKKTCGKCQIAQRTKSHRYCTKCHNEYMRVWRLKHPLTENQRLKANIRRKTNMQVQRGLLIPYPCEICNAKSVEAHHDDYRKPYCVRWLCKKHHNAYHATQNRKRMRK